MIDRTNNGMEFFHWYEEEEEDSFDDVDLQIDMEMDYRREMEND